jgi:HAD superfamily hydrolase (TIGR01509 family)
MTLLIFDFDGVVADSELIANTALARALTGIGLPTSVEESLGRYLGRRWADNEADIVAALGGPLPPGFQDNRRAEVRAVLAAELTEVAGLSAFLAAHPDWARCIASSGTHEWLDLALDIIGLAALFPRRFSGASDVAHGKPAPDLFLHAAASMGFAPADCIVIEDSVAGVRGGVAAEMRVIGLVAGTHIRDGHADTLRTAGAHAVAANYEEVAALLGDWR